MTTEKIILQVNTLTMNTVTSLIFTNLCDTSQATMWRISFYTHRDICVGFRILLCHGRSNI